MLYRNKKPDDPNEGKWIAIGGKIEDGETPEAANIREVYEESGIKLSLEDCRFRGIIKFINTVYEDEEIYLYTAEVADDTVFSPCNEGELHWVKTCDLLNLNLWDGDRRFLVPMLAGEDNINMTLYYDGDVLLQ